MPSGKRGAEERTARRGVCKRWRPASGCLKSGMGVKIKQKRKAIRAFLCVRRRRRHGFHTKTSDSVLCTRLCANAWETVLGPPWLAGEVALLTAQRRQRRDPTEVQRDCVYVNDY